MLYRIEHFRKHLVTGICTVLSACSAVGPNYEAPTFSGKDVPANWTSRTDVPPETARPRVAKQEQVPPWWTELSDSVLDTLVTEAFTNNPTIEAAVARLRQSRAAYTQSVATSAPSANVSGSSQRTSDSSGTLENESSLSMNSSWEIDLFGAVRRGKEGALAREGVQIATLADVRVSLSAEVADAYLGHRTCQSRLALNEQDLVSREATERLTTDSIRAGFTAPYQGIRSTASVAEAKTLLTATRSQCDQIENLLTRLTGLDRPRLMKLLAERPTGLARLPVPKHFSVAIPREALMQRPDIRAAERAVAAASADIGLAEADRYPRIALNGSLGYSATGSSGSGLLSFGTWSFGPSVSLPLFDGGRRKAAVAVANSKYDESLANFKSTTRRAIQEVEDALTRYAATHERAENARVSANQYQQFFEAVGLRYREGANNLLELEDARRAMLTAQKTLLSVQHERLQAWVALNRATGGSARYEPDSVSSGQSPAATATHP